MRASKDTCTQEGCSTRASFGLDGKATRCLVHKSSNMTDVMNPKCGREGCDTRKYKNESLCMYHLKEPSLFD